MDKEHKVSLPNDFPQELLNSAKSLGHLGIVQMAWNWENAIKTIEFLYKKKYFILGGDVFKLVDSSLELTYDSWYTNRSEKINENDELIDLARYRAISYIKEYHRNNGEDFYYSLVYEKI